MRVRALTLVVLLSMLMLVLRGKGARYRFAEAGSTWLSPTALLLLPLTQITSLCYTLSLFGPHVAGGCRDLDEETTAEHTS